MKVFFAFFGLGLGLIAAACLAASGDIKYEVRGEPVEISGAKALSAGNWAVSNGVWDGAAADLQHVAVYKGGDGKFYAVARGIKSAPAGSVPDGARFKGVVP